MTDHKTGAAQNKLGELFIDFGTKGAGNLLKGLNGIQAQFLLTKNAAVQFMKPLIDIGKQSINSAIDIAKLSNSLGSTVIETQKLLNYFKEKNLNDSLLGDMENISNKITDIHRGAAGIDIGMARAFNLLGLNIRDYNGSLDSTVQLIKDVETSIKGIDPVIARSYLRDLGMSTEWLYAFQRGDFNMRDAFLVSDTAIKSQIEAAEAMNRAKLAKDVVVSETMGKAAPYATPALNEAATLMEGKEKDTNTKRWGAASAAVGVAGIGAAVGSVVPIVGTIAGGGLGFLIGGVGGLYYLGKQRKKQNNGTPTGFASPIAENINIDYPKSLSPLGLQNYSPSFMKNNMEIPSNISGLSQNINITNENRIQGSNAAEIADAISKINIQDIEYAQYQAHNLPGV